MRKRIFLSVLVLFSFFILVDRVEAVTEVNSKYKVLLKESVSIDIVKREFDKQGIKVIDTIPEINFFTVTTEKSKEEVKKENNDLIEDILEDNIMTVKPNITYLYGENVITNSNVDFWAHQWDMQKSISTGSKFNHKSSGEATIGVIDSGVTYDNPEIYSNIISVQNFTTDLETGALGEQNILDKTGHGTSVVGQISSNGQYLGIAPGMKIRMYRVFDEGNAQDQWILKALVQAAKDDVDVINLSLGEYLLKDSSDEDDNTALINIYQRAINYAHNQGSIVVASVGDEGMDLQNQAELKNYLGNLRGNIELLEMTDLDEKQLDFMASMNHSVGIFEKYFNSMVNYSRLLIEDKDYQEDIDLSEFLDELSLECRDIMFSKQIDFQIVNTADIQMIKGNRLNLDRALLNILSNAVRYCSEEGKVILSISSERSNFISFEIWNSGLPFTEEALKDGGKLFYTENKGRSDKHYGIGLSFAQKIAMRHQGELVLSNPQKGGAQVTLLIKNISEVATKK